MHRSCLLFFSCIYLYILSNTFHTFFIPCFPSTIPFDVIEGGVCFGYVYVWDMFMFWICLCLCLGFGYVVLDFACVWICLFLDGILNICWTCLLIAMFLMCMMNISLASMPFATCIVPVIFCTF
jgi:hypothetical protein